MVRKFCILKSPCPLYHSAGVGRTGTFITLDVMLQRIRQEDSIDVFGFVRQMRYQRNFMVQTEVCEIDDESPKTKLSSEHLDVRKVWQLKSKC